MITFNITSDAFNFVVNTVVMQYTMFYTTKLDASDISRCPSIATLTLLLIITFNLHHSTTQYQSLKRVEIGIKGQLIFKSKLSVNSSKKRTNEFVFTSMLRVCVHFLEEIEDSKKAFRNYVTSMENVIEHLKVEKK